MGRIRVLAAIAVVGVAACSPKPAAQTTSSTVGPDPQHLVVVDASGDAVVVAEDGTEVRRLTEAGATMGIFQPIWSPDGSSVAYGQIGDGGASVVVTGRDGQPIADHPTPEPVIYLSWSPTGALAWLRNDVARGLAFEAVGRDGETLTDHGAPLYFAWSPDGSEVLAHVGSDRLETLGFGHDPEAVGDTPGAFPAPWWTERGQFYLTQDTTGQRLVEDDGSGPTPVARVRGSAQFVASGSRIAIRSFDPGGSGFAASLQEIPLVPADRLTVLDLDTGTLTEVAGPRTIAFFWSPGGDRLLVLEAIGDEAGTVRWIVWSPEGTTAYTEFFLEDSWVGDFLPFFDQYAQSVRLWSPDGSAFAFPGSLAGTQGIWVQRIGEDDPTRISDGTWVDWAPASSASL